MFENTFSRRKGYTPPPVQGKLEELSDHVRNRLWDVLHLDIYGNHHWRDRRDLVVSDPLQSLFEGVWTDLYHKRIDEFPGPEMLWQSLREGFLKGVWHFPFDIFEAVFENAQELMHYPNEVASRIRDALERENQAYTFVGHRFIERMTPQEVESVESALEIPIEGVRVHLTDALGKLSDRETPDFRNSIKESISAVEAACRHLAKKESATLSEALKLLDNQRPFHPAFKDAIVKLYGWTSDEGGIRHAIKDTDKVERADAQFMLVACSAFVNYLFSR